MSTLLNKIPFSTLSKEEQQVLRRQYRITHLKHYNYSIVLFVLFCVFGILMLLGILTCLLDLMIGSLLSVLSLIGFIVTTYFLYRSNDKFVRFLSKKGYRYK